MTTPLPEDIQVLAVPTSIDYTSKDYQAFVQAMLAYAGQIMPDWNTTSEGDFGVAMVELLAYGLDILSYYGDRITQEAYLPTATQRLSLLNIAQLLGYVPSNGIAATGTVTFQTPSNGPQVVIPAGTQVATGFNSSADGPIIYQTTAQVTCPDDGGTVTANVSQGVTYSMVTLGTSDGTPGQTFQIPQTGVLDGSVSVFVETATGSTEWQPVAFLVDAGNEDTVFSTWVDENGVTNVNFGDGVNGLIPAIGLTIYATYTVIVGSLGNVAAGQVGVVVSDLPGIVIPYLGDGVTFNSSAMTGGADAETNDEIRANAPAQFRTAQRAVSPQDYADLALAVPGVLLASAVMNHSTSVTLYVLGPGYAAPNSTLQTNILNYFVGKTIGGVSLSISSPAQILVDVGTSGNHCTLFVKPNYSQATVLANVQSAITAALSPPNMAIGQLLTVSQIYDAALAVDGVAYIIIPVFTREDTTQTGITNIQFRASEIPGPGTLYVDVTGGF